MTGGEGVKGATGRGGGGLTANVAICGDRRDRLGGISYGNHKDCRDGVMMVNYCPGLSILVDSVAIRALDV